MTKTDIFKTRVESLGREVSFLRLNEEELKSRIFSMDPPISIEVDTEELDASLESIELGDYPMIVESETGFYFDIVRVVEIMYNTIDQFEDKVLPFLLKADLKKLKQIISELYINIVLLNPPIDSMAFRVLGYKEPLEDELMRLSNRLPSPISSSIGAHIYIESWIDSPFEDFDEEAQVYEVPEGSVELDNESIVSIDVEKVKTLKVNLATSVIGQNHAIDHVVAVAKRISAGFRDPKRPPAVMLFAGPSGVGKTLLAKETSRLLFGRSTSFGRVDCATLSEKHDVSKLFGPPPGYVGYPSDRHGDPKEADPSILYKETLGFAEGGILLLDEVEKAHPDIWDSFLTIFDEGYAKTSVGNIIDFRNTVIVLTTNLGSEKFAKDKNRFPLGFSSAKKLSDNARDLNRDIKATKKTAVDAASGYMKPELLGRITTIVPFVDLTLDELKTIVDLEWTYSSGYVLAVCDAPITIDSTVRDRIAEVCMNKGSGARMISRLVDGYIIDPLAELHVENNKIFNGSSQITVRYSNSDNGCDTVEVLYGKNKVFKYDVAMTLGDE
jgi:DNA polymerase III delta prime subunit